MFLIDGMRERSWLLTAASIKSFTFELRREWLYVSRPVNLFSLLPSINPSINFNLFNQLSFLLFKDSCCPREPKWKQFKNCWNGVGPRERSLRLITNQFNKRRGLLPSFHFNQSTILHFFLNEWKEMKSWVDWLVFSSTKKANPGSPSNWRREEKKNKSNWFHQFVGAPQTHHSPSIHQPPIKLKKFNLIWFVDWNWWSELVVAAPLIPFHWLI